MPISIKMPVLSPTMKKGSLTKWTVKEGQEVKIGDIIAEIETDKSVMEFDSITDGTIAKLLVKNGQENIPVGSIIGWILEEDETIADLEDYIKTNPSENENLESSNEKNNSSNGCLENTKLADNLSSVRSDINVGEINVSDSNDRSDCNSTKPGTDFNTDSLNNSNTSHANRIKISPLAKRLISGKDIDLNNINGTGPNGRIVKEDVVSYLKTKPNQTNSRSAVSSRRNDTNTNCQMFSEHEPKHTKTSLSGMRQVISDRMSFSKQSIPHAYLRLSADISKLKSLKSDLQEDGLKTTINHWILFMTSKTLKKFPSMNSALFVSESESYVKNYENIDLNFAVTIDGGLITPVIRKAEQKTLEEIVSISSELAEKAKSGKLQSHEYQGGTFTISNLGMLGIESFDAVINPPQGAILAVGSGLNNRINLSLSIDHRIIDGYDAALFLRELKQNIENPIRIIR
ncbi:dihydrolipoamide acetyltransferase family protein [Candidatus Nesciobacter abundans]|uniref:Dihydrolipoamide acetyltransferase component of pyruvate dehydrogenase complex n=1 Tax=Candidatus Nesciobacter abundans TaxID=2601668 RepID=A0A5C0UHD1_9PROT|nr:dihydrolipoamide acetyltransferase family protein [Candidatus Nesciobacter abundans]QEK39117.1 2-oxo acid dehydrogenase subunit E2 [Candidatus Nesciobacter abundans]